jgi:hypothetical protein
LSETLRRAGERLSEPARIPERYLASTIRESTVIATRSSLAFTVSTIIWPPSGVTENESLPGWRGSAGIGEKASLAAGCEVQHYSIDYSFDGSQLHFLPLENATYRSVLTLMVASFDSEGTMLTGISQVGISNLEPAVYKDVINGEFRWHQEVDVPWRQFRYAWAFRIR